MNGYVIIGIIGVVSGILCAQADVPLAWSGRKGDHVDAKSMRQISKWWTEVPEGHFDKSFWLSFIGQPGTYLTMWMLAELVSASSVQFALAMKINTFIGAYTGLLFHCVYCTKPLVYRHIWQETSEENAKAAVDAVGKYAKVPSVICGISLFLAGTMLTAAAILKGYLDVPVWFAALNPVGALPVLLVCRKLGIRIGGAMGIGYSLLAVVLIFAGMNV